MTSLFMLSIISNRVSFEKVRVVWPPVWGRAGSRDAGLTGPVTLEALPADLHATPPTRIQLTMPPPIFLYGVRAQGDTILLLAGAGYQIRRPPSSVAGRRAFSSRITRPKAWPSLQDGADLRTAAWFGEHGRGSRFEQVGPSAIGLTQPDNHRNKSWQPPGHFDYIPVLSVSQPADDFPEIPRIQAAADVNVVIELNDPSQQRVSVVTLEHLVIFQDEGCQAQVLIRVPDLHRHRPPVLQPLLH